jgi:hypothetical protein
VVLLGFLGGVECGFLHFLCIEKECVTSQL